MTCAALAVPQQATPDERRVDIGRQIMREHPEWQYLTRRFVPSAGGYDYEGWRHVPALFDSAHMQVSHDWRQARTALLGLPEPIQPRYAVDQPAHRSSADSPSQESVWTRGARSAA